MHVGGIFERELISSAPRITVTGCDLVQVEQHSGLVIYQDDEVALSSSVGLVHIHGQGLTFTSYSADEAVVRGEISALTLEGSTHAKT